MMQTTPPTAFNPSSNGWTDIVTVVIVWDYSIGVIVFIAIIYYLLKPIDLINDLGRKDRQAKGTHMENILVQLNKVAIEHDRDSATGFDRYYLVEKVAAEDDE